MSRISEIMREKRCGYLEAERIAKDEFRVGMSLPPAPGSARLYECLGCGERKPQEKFPDDPAVPGLCAACDLLVRSRDEPLEAAHREEAQNNKIRHGGPDATK